jgi:hypothetical protein
MSNKVYYCHLCSHPYADSAFTTPSGIRYDKISPQQNCVQVDSCPGQGFGGLCVPSGKTQADIINEENNIPISGVLPSSTKRKLGLCVFLMDSSGSMGDAAYDPNFPSTLGVEPHINNSPCEKLNQMSKRELMATNAALGIFSLKQIKDSENAFVAIFLYDHNTKYLFFKSVKTVITEYGDSRTLAKYLLKEMKELNGGTNINSALDLAASLVNEFKKGTIKALGQFEPYVQTPRQNWDVSTGQPIKPSTLLPNTPNIRVLLYTDGEHQAEYGVLESPFQFDVPDFLIGVYIGQNGQQGDKELSKIVKYCPIHGKQQYLRVSNPQDSGKLYGIFKMATGASGFCLQCIEGKGSDKPSVMR